MNPPSSNFPGILGDEFNRAFRGQARLRPGSVPGMLISRTTRGVSMRPLARPAAFTKSEVEEATVTAIYDDVLEVSGTVSRLVAKPYSLRCSGWAGDNSWSPGDAFRYQNSIPHPRLNWSEAYDFQYVVGDGAWLRTKVYNRAQTVAGIGAMTYTLEPQLIYPRYIEQWPAETVGQTILIQKVTALGFTPGTPWVLTEAIIDPLTSAVIWPVGTAVEWIDLNIDGRRWVSIPEAIYFQRTFDSAVAGIQDGQVLHWNQDT